MNCKNYLKLINKLIDNELESSQKLSLESHLKICPECFTAFKELGGLKKTIRQIPAFDGNPFLWTRIYEAIKNSPVAEPIFALPKFFKTWVAVAAAFTIITGGLLFAIPEDSEETDPKTEMESAIYGIPSNPENLERITINFLVYTNSKHV